MAHETAVKEGSFLAQVIDATPGGQRLLHCLQCGSCGGSCPSGADMQFTPRALFALINADQREAVLSANTMWACVSCYFCTTRCPQNIPITDIIYTLKRISIAEGMAKDTDAPALAKTFTDLLDKHGRSFEFGLASRFYLFNKPLAMLRMGPLGLSMFTRGRMALTPTKIKKLDQLHAIINKARELGAEGEGGKTKDEG
jgi:heterodisulfide reductase subunit C